MGKTNLRVYTDATAGNGRFADYTTLGLVVEIDGRTTLRTYKRTRVKEQHIIAAELLALLQAFAYLIPNRKKLFAEFLPDSFCYAEDSCRIGIPFSVCSDNDCAVLICNRIFSSAPLKKLGVFAPEPTFARIEKFHRIFPAALVEHVPGRFNPADGPSRAKFHSIT
jgi:hypothetical protein